MNSTNEKICYFCWYRTKDLYSVFKYCPSIYTFNDFGMVESRNQK